MSDRTANNMGLASGLHRYAGDASQLKLRLLFTDKQSISARPNVTCKNNDQDHASENVNRSRVNKNGSFLVTKLGSRWTIQPEQRCAWFENGEFRLKIRSEPLSCTCPDNLCESARRGKRGDRDLCSSIRLWKQNGGREDEQMESAGPNVRDVDGNEQSNGFTSLIRAGKANVGFVQRSERACNWKDTVTVTSDYEWQRTFARKLPSEMRNYCCRYCSRHCMTLTRSVDRNLSCGSCADLDFCNKIGDNSKQDRHNCADRRTDWYQDWLLNGRRDSTICERSRRLDRSEAAKPAEVASAQAQARICENVDISEPKAASPAPSVGVPPRGNSPGNWQLSSISTGMPIGRWTSNADGFLDSAKETTSGDTVTRGDVDRADRSVSDLIEHSEGARREAEIKARRHTKPQATGCRCWSGGEILYIWMEKHEISGGGSESRWRQPQICVVAGGTSATIERLTTDQQSLAPSRVADAIVSTSLFQHQTVVENEESNAGTKHDLDVEEPHLSDHRSDSQKQHDGLDNDKIYNNATIDSGTLGGGRQKSDFASNDDRESSYEKSEAVDLREGVRREEVANDNAAGKRALGGVTGREDEFGRMQQEQLESKFKRRVGRLNAHCLAVIVIDALDRFIQFRPDLNKLVSIDSCALLSLNGDINCLGKVACDGRGRQWHHGSVCSGAANLSTQFHTTGSLLYQIQLVENPEQISTALKDLNTLHKCLVSKDAGETSAPEDELSCRSSVRIVTDSSCMLRSTNRSVVVNLQLDLLSASDFPKDCQNLYVRYKLSARTKGSKWNLTLQYPRPTNTLALRDEGLKGSIPVYQRLARKSTQMSHSEDGPSDSRGEAHKLITRTDQDGADKPDDEGTRDTCLLEGSTVTTLPDSRGQYHFSCAEQLVLEFTPNEMPRNVAAHSRGLNKIPSTLERQQKELHFGFGTVEERASNMKRDPETHSLSHPIVVGGETRSAEIIEQTSGETADRKPTESSQANLKVVSDSPLFDDNQNGNLRDMADLHRDSSKAEACSELNLRRQNSLHLIKGSNEEDKDCVEIALLLEFYSSDFYRDKLQGWAQKILPLNLNCDDTTTSCARHQMAAASGCRCTKFDLPVIGREFSSPIDKLRYYLIGQLPESDPGIETFARSNHRYMLQTKQSGKLLVNFELVRQFSSQNLPPSSRGHPETGYYSTLVRPPGNIIARKSNTNDSIGFRTFETSEVVEAYRRVKNRVEKLRLDKQLEIL